VRHERRQSLSHREGACRVNYRSLIAWDKSSRGLCRLAAMFARGHGNDACGEASHSVSTAGVGYGAGCDSGVSCCSLRVVLGWGRVSCSSRVDVSWLVTCRMRRHAVGPTVWSSGVDRWFTLRLAVWSSRVDRWLAVGLAVRRGWIKRRLAPARARRR
jgi:hypothetical protein